jgi:hypothetical protein
MTDNGRFLFQLVVTILRGLKNLLHILNSIFTYHSRREYMFIGKYRAMYLNTEGIIC